MIKEVFMAMKRSAAKINLAKAPGWPGLSWLFALAAFVCISACGGARNQAENQSVEGNRADKSDSSVMPKPAEEETAREVLFFADMAPGANGADSINVMVANLPEVAAADSINVMAADADPLQSAAANLDNKGIDNLVKASESMVQAKVATRRDVLSAQIRLADDRAELIRTQTEYQLAFDALKEVIGLPIEMPIGLAEAELRFSPAAFDEEALLKLALENSPSTHSAEIAVDRARLALKVARNTLLPQLDLAISHSGQLDKDKVQYKNLWTTGLQATVNLSYPFLNREAAANAENAQIAVSQQQDRLVDLQRQIVLGVRSIIRIAQSTTEELNALQGTIAAAEEKVEFATAMFRLGRASNLDIIDAQEALFKAQNQYVSKLVDYHTQLALLESLTGQPLIQ
jgi:outer membrane protein TolC